VPELTPTRSFDKINLDKINFDKINTEAAHPTGGQQQGMRITASK
jgi:hypothetical protein